MQTQTTHRQQATDAARAGQTPDADIRPNLAAAGVLDAASLLRQRAHHATAQAAADQEICSVVLSSATGDGPSAVLLSSGVLVCLSEDGWQAAAQDADGQTPRAATAEEAQEAQEAPQAEGTWHATLPRRTADRILRAHGQMWLP